jgi:glycine/D-amino acid oxidase-like deaminating enzyme
LLLGGGRNLDFDKETTTKFELNGKIHARLELMLKKIILPETKFEVEHRWCGIMGVGSEKSPIVKKISDNVVCAVRMGGMGVAIGSLVGKMASKELE